jgi:hypothetical protein
MGKGYLRSVHFVDKPLVKWVCKNEHIQNAERLVKFLSNFKEENLKEENKELALKIWDARCHSNERETCWYAGFENADENNLFIVMHFDIKADYINVYYRRMDFMQGSKLEGWHEWTKNGKYVRFDNNKEIILHETEQYLRRIYDALQKKQLKITKFAPSYP